MHKYFYGLGHAPQIANEEFASIKQSKLDQEKFNSKYLLSNTELDVNKTGSIVFGGDVLFEFETTKNNQKLRELLLEYLAKSLEFNSEKKVGLSVPKQLYSKDIIKVAKENGVRKLNLLVDKTPNIGNWKGLKTWIIAFKMDETWIIGKITSYFDQELWSKIDTTLPKGKMSRGLINLKLARSLLNLTKNKVVWDPFCGAGRIPIAGLDLKEQFISSDIDSECVEESMENYAFICEEDPFPTSTVLCKPFVLDAKYLDLPAGLYKEDSKLAIVTEGYLGTNFKKTPNPKEIKQEYNELKILWTSLFQSAEKIANLNEIIFCLPYYLNSTESDYYLSRVESWLGGTKFNLFSFQSATNKEHYLLYSRADSIVGHAIFKVTL